MGARAITLTTLQSIHTLLEALPIGGADAAVVPRAGAGKGTTREMGVPTTRRTVDA